MAVADRLVAKAQEYEQRSAHHVEKAELTNGLDEKLAALVFTGVAIALREIVEALQEEEAEDLAA